MPFRVTAAARYNPLDRHGRAGDTHSLLRGIGLNVTGVEVGPLLANCWIVSASASSPVVVVDPGGDADVILAHVGTREVAAVVLTHGHFDHVGGAAALVEATGAPLLVHEADAARLASDGPTGTGGAPFGFAGIVAPHPDGTVRDADVVEAGALTLEVLHTPGHTAGGICLFALDPDGGAPHLFSGDTLFAGSVGRTDFPGGDGRALAASIAAKLSALPPETVVHPGHGPDTTIAREARLNPFWPRT